jgi:hypothetical protein
MLDIISLHRKALVILAAKKVPPPIEIAGPLGTRSSQPLPLPSDMVFLRTHDAVLTYHLAGAGLFDGERLKLEHQVDVAREKARISA